MRSILQHLGLDSTCDDSIIVKQVTGNSSLFFLFFFFCQCSVFVLCAADNQVNVNIAASFFVLRITASVTICDCDLLAKGSSVRDRTKDTWVYLQCECSGMLSHHEPVQCCNGVSLLPRCVESCHIVPLSCAEQEWRPWWIRFERTEVWTTWTSLSEWMGHFTNCIRSELSSSGNGCTNVSLLSFFLSF